MILIISDRLKDFVYFVHIALKLKSVDQILNQRGAGQYLEENLFNTFALTFQYTKAS